MKYLAQELVTHGLVTHYTLHRESKAMTLTRSSGLRCLVMLCHIPCSAVLTWRSALQQSVTFSVVYSVTLTAVCSVTLSLVCSVTLTVVYNVTLSVVCSVTLTAVYSVTLSLVCSVTLSVLCSVTFIAVYSVTLLLVCSVTFAAVYNVTLSLVCKREPIEGIRLRVCACSISRISKGDKILPCR